jgi:hypothetical protein
VINSGATQSDHLRLLLDWMELLNAGYAVTPVGSSDSHDVARHFVGQGRTYVRADDRDPGNIDIEAAVHNFHQGRVRVSYGLMAELKVNGRYDSGELAAVAGNEVQLDVRVLGPHWVNAEVVQLYANGRLIREEPIHADGENRLPAGVQYQSTWKLPLPKQDVHLVAIALGAGIDEPYWATAKPYQPTSPKWQASTLGCSGAIRLDADGDGRWSCARDYAQRLWGANGGDAGKLLETLVDYDEPTAAHTAHLYRLGGGGLLTSEFSALLNAAPDSVQRGIRKYIAAWRESEAAALSP